jgi:hypothetical protein
MNSKSALQKILKNRTVHTEEEDKLNHENSEKNKYTR